MTIIVIMVIAGNAAAAGKTSIGIKAGMVLSSITQAPEEWEDELSYKWGFVGGAFLNYAFNDKFSLQPELLYTQKGVIGNLYEGFVDVDVTASFDYFELPVLAIYKFRSKEKFRPLIYGGPSFAYCSSSELKLSASIFSAAVDFSSLTHVTDFGLVVGTGFDYVLNNGILTFDVRFQYGFTNVVMSGDFLINDEVHTINVDDFKNITFYFMLGYIF